MNNTMVALLAMLAGGCATADDDDAWEMQALQAPPFFGGDPANQALFAADVSFWELPLAQSQVDCYWDAGIRHLIAGTQDSVVARQQLAMAVSRGMTVDAYVYLYWDVDIDAQIDAAFAMVDGLPIGRMWIDIEQDPAGLGANALIPMIEQSLTRCETKAPGRCGIYTGPGWWKTYLLNTIKFGDVPLWYAQYNGKRSLSHWATERFGGWAKPVAKQFQTAPLCGAGGTDWNVMKVEAVPTVAVARSLPPDNHEPPVAPTNLWPGDGMVIPIDYVKIMSGTVPRATAYQLALENYTNGVWRPYYTWTNANAYVKVSPPPTPTLYRLRARAQNVYGWGLWSDYAMFDYGNYTGPRPTTATNPPPPQSSVPASLSPSGVTITTSAVTLAASSVTNATSYQFEVASQIAGIWTAYYTYTTSAPNKLFTPQARGRDYRFRVRAMVSATYGAWSSHAVFFVQ